MHHSIMKRGQNPIVKKCEVCCEKYHCAYCKTVCNHLHEAQNHAVNHIRNAVQHEDFIIIKCGLNCRPSPHFHCCYCRTTIIRRDGLTKHVSTCKGTAAAAAPPPQIRAPRPAPASSESPAPASSGTPAATPPAMRSRVRRQVTVTCSHCGMAVNRRNLKVHINRRHSQRTKDVTAERHLSCQCIDATNGIFAVQRSFFKPCSPVHVKKSTYGESRDIVCELEDCAANAEVAVRSGNVPHGCVHVKSLQFWPRSDVTHVALDEETLSEMVACRLFGTARKRSCLDRQRDADDARVPLSVEVTVGGTPTKRFLSVYEPNVSYYSRLGRVMAAYDSKKRSWHCPCAKPRRSCIHKALAKWHLFKTDRDLFATGAGDERGPAPGREEASRGGRAYPPGDRVLARMVSYLMKNKGLPAQLPQHLVTGSKSSSDLPKTLTPRETSCAECGGLLGEPVLVTARAKVVAYTGVVEGFSTYYKSCPDCGLTYRYQEWDEGLHNFNDHVLLTLHMCILLRASLQMHHSVSRVIEVLERTERKTFPKKATMLHAYLHFEAMTSHDYMYSCYRCGYYPPVVVMDLHRKGAFNMPASEAEAPSARYDGTVDVERFWERVASEIVCRGLLKSGRKNPFAVVPGYDFWAPWIGKETRKGDAVLNTEQEKARAPRQAAEGSDLQTTEEMLQDALVNEKVDAIRKLCRRCGLDARGSKMDLILRLRQEMRTGSSCDKIFEKVWGASGGWAVAMCPCAVVYSVKFNMRAESPRDYADILLSWKHFPNVVIYDFARGLAAHTNSRCPEELPFAPHDGRLAEASETNLRLAAEGKLKVALPWLKRKRTDTEAGCHPVTGSSERYALYDGFHERNTKDPRDALRRIALVPEMAGRVNSQCAEQLFADMRKNNYFLNTLTPSEHIFVVRNMLHHHNAKRNQNIKDGLREAVGPDVALRLDAYGRITMGHANPSDASPGVTASARMWDVDRLPAQSDLLAYVLDRSGDPDEELLRLSPTQTLKRSDFWSLAFEELEATIANQCFHIISRIAASRGKDVYAVDSYVVLTWLPPYNNDPMPALPEDAASREFILLPSWESGHWIICILKPRSKEMIFLDSMNPGDFGRGTYVQVFRSEE